MRKVERVSYKQVYDLVFRARNARLNSAVFVLDFSEWVKAGIAFNTRGWDLSTRKISEFVKLYNIMEQCVSEDSSDPISANLLLFENALTYYYRDIYDVYQDYIKSKQISVRVKAQNQLPRFDEILIIPAYEGFNYLKDVFDVCTESLSNYHCKRESAFLADVNSVYLQAGTDLFSCMSMMYDYGYENRKVLLEVELW